MKKFTLLMGVCSMLILSLSSAMASTGTSTSTGTMNCCNIFIYNNTAATTLNQVKLSSGTNGCPTQFIDYNNNQNHTDMGTGNLWFFSPNSTIRINQLSSSSNGVTMSLANCTPMSTTITTPAQAENLTLAKGNNINCTGTVTTLSCSDKQ